MIAGYCQLNPEFGKKEHNVAQALRMIEDCRSELMVLPELFSTGYLFRSRDEVAALAERVPEGYTSRLLMEFCARKKKYVVAGIAEKEGTHLYNSASLFGPEGHMLTYRKIHLFNEEKNLFSPGNFPLKVISVNSLNIGIMICFDWIFPEAARILALEGADVICHPANLILPFCPEAMKTRSIENRVYSITANRTGVEERRGKSLHFIGKSQIVNPFGAVLIRSNREDVQVGEAEIDPALSRDKQVLEFNHLFSDRRPEYYHLLVQDKGLQKLKEA